jgi:hypothetical protein
MLKVLSWTDTSFRLTQSYLPANTPLIPSRAIESYGMETRRGKSQRSEIDSLKVTSLTSADTAVPERVRRIPSRKFRIFLLVGFVTFCFSFDSPIVASASQRAYEIVFTHSECDSHRFTWYTPSQPVSRGKYQSSLTRNPKSLLLLHHEDLQKGKMLKTFLMPSVRTYLGRRAEPVRT